MIPCDWRIAPALVSAIWLEQLSWLRLLTICRYLSESCSFVRPTYTTIQRYNLLNISLQKLIYVVTDISPGTQRTESKFCHSVDGSTPLLRGFSSLFCTNSLSHSRTQLHLFIELIRNITKSTIAIRRNQATNTEVDERHTNHENPPEPTTHDLTIHWECKESRDRRRSDDPCHTLTSDISISGKWWSYSDILTPAAVPIPLIAPSAVLSGLA